MMRIKTDAQAVKVYEVLKRNHSEHVELDDNGVFIHDYVTFDEMREICDILRSEVMTKQDLFEECWKAYRRKGVKSKAREQWCRLKDDEKERVLAHVRAYVGSRELTYQKDFERYLRDRVFNEVVTKGNTVVYDPMPDNTATAAYSPICGGAILHDEQNGTYIYTGFWDGENMPDGYEVSNRPDGARIILNNGRGVLVWSTERKVWEKCAEL